MTIEQMSSSDNSRLDLLKQELKFLSKALTELVKAEDDLEKTQEEAIIRIERLTMKISSLENAKKMFVGWLSSLSMALLIEILLKRFN